MSETKLESKGPRGFAGLITSGLLPLNEKEKFKEQFAIAYQNPFKCSYCKFCSTYYNRKRKKMINILFNLNKSKNKYNL